MQCSNYVCERGAICQYKVYKRGTFTVKMICKRVRTGPPGGAFPYKTLWSTPPPFPPHPLGKKRKTLPQTANG